jgi:Rad3-related DNA helicase
LDDVMDVEDLGKAGEAHGVCTYYASRNASPYADLLVLPHSALLAQVRQYCLYNS